MRLSYLKLKININLFRNILHEHYPYFIVLALYIGIGMMILKYFDYDEFANLHSRYLLIYTRTVLLVIGYFLILAVHWFARVLAKIIEKTTGRVRRKNKEIKRVDWFIQVPGFIIIVTTIPLFLTIFTNLKQVIPNMNEFSWDQRFMMIDFIIHGENHPWELIQPFLGYPSITNALDVIYITWFYILYFFIIWMGFSRRRRLRAQFFLSITISWVIIGTILATLFSSAGPCFYQNVTGDGDSYRNLMDYLVKIHEQKFLFAIIFQNALWESYKINYVGVFSGISAMPSIHVATSVIFSLVAWKVRPVLGITFFLYALIIQVGSVHLGWHYAVDGYLGAILMVLVWKAVDRFLTMIGWRNEEDFFPVKEHNCNMDRL